MHWKVPHSDPVEQFRPDVPAGEVVTITGDCTNQNTSIGMLLRLGDCNDEVIDGALLDIVDRLTKCSAHLSLLGGVVDWHSDTTQH